MATAEGAARAKSAFAATQAVQIHAGTIECTMERRCLILKSNLGLVSSGMA